MSETPFSAHGQNSSHPVRGVLHHPAGKETKMKVLILAQPGLGASCSDSEMCHHVKEKFGENFFNEASVLEIDHPWHGRNAVDPGIEDFTIWHARDATCASIQKVLDSIEPDNLILLGNSLGFWTLFQACALFGHDPRIKFLFGKSGIVSYIDLLSRKKHEYGSLDTALKVLFRMDQEGWCTLQTNIGKSPFKLHRTFFDKIYVDICEVKTSAIPTEVWHGEHDPFTNIYEMRAHNAGNIIVHTEQSAGHPCLPHTDANILSRIYNEISRLK